ncbi:hypothetical protein PAJ34TS1_38760 [Paenibacillus azoreducens]
MSKKDANLHLFLQFFYLRRKSLQKCNFLQYLCLYSEIFTGKDALWQQFGLEHTRVEEKVALLHFSSESNSKLYQVTK